MNPARVIGWMAVAEKALVLWRRWRMKRASRKAYKETLKRYNLLLPFAAMLIMGCEEPWDDEQHMSEQEKQIIAAEIHPGTIVLGDRTTVGGNVDSLNQSIITGEDVEIGGSVNSGPPKEQ